MKIRQITEHVWTSAFEERRDRPSLGLIIGEKFNVAVDAGHWAHTVGMHAVHGLTVAEKRTEQLTFCIHGIRAVP